MTKVSGHQQAQKAVVSENNQPSPIRSTIKKITIFATAIVAVAIPLYVTFYGQHHVTADECETPIPDTISPSSSQLSAEIPYYWRGFVHNGIWTINTGMSWIGGCYISPNLIDFWTCKDSFLRASKAIFAQSNLMNDILETQNSDSKGYEIFLPDDNQRLLFGMKEMARPNHERALEIVTQEVLRSDFANTDIEATLLKVHKTLTDGLVERQYAGQYRDKPIIIQPDDKMGMPSFLASKLQELKGNHGVNIFNEFISKLKENPDDYESVIKTLTQEEREVLNLIFDIPPMPSELPAHMKTFIADYRKKLLDKTLDAIERASWVHMELIKIHPFTDGNGRLARILMNAELMRSGQKPCIFFYDRAYTKAIRKDLKKPGAFATYLAKSCKETIPLMKVTQFPDLV